MPDLADSMTLDQQVAYLTRGCVDVVRARELRDKVERSQRTGTALVVKVGFDPTAPDLHLGHTVLLRKMRHFQDLGHRVIFVIGDFTGMIGDPTGRAKTRPPLTRAEIDANAETYRTQVFKILDPVKTVIDFNRRWLEPLGSDGWIRLAARYNVAQMLERRDFRQRYEGGQPIALHEFLYPLAQAYDSVALKADVELGGTDQLFNLNVGRDIMPAYGLEPQIVMTVPLLVGLDGVEKMSKSLGNYVGVNEPPVVVATKLVEEFRGSDEVLWQYFLLLTDLAPEEIERLKGAMAAGSMTPADVRYRLARLVVGDLHGSAAAARAEDEIRSRHAVRALQRGRKAGDGEVAPGGAAAGTPESEELARLAGAAHMPTLEVEVAEDGSIGIGRAIVDLNFAPSASEATRQIRAGGVRIDGARVAELRWVPPARGRTYLLSVGSKKLARLTVR
jgi:tyrosyl-tRNA synthetase